MNLCRHILGFALLRQYFFQTYCREFLRGDHIVVAHGLLEPKVGSLTNLHSLKYTVITQKRANVPRADIKSSPLYVLFFVKFATLVCTKVRFRT